MQKVAKKIILLISFKFSASISFVQTGSKRAIRNQMGPNGSNGVKLGQTGKMVTIGAKLDQTGKSRPNVAKYKSNRANWGKIGLNSQIGQTEPNWVK